MVSCLRETSHGVLKEFGRFSFTARNLEGTVYIRKGSMTITWKVRDNVKGKESMGYSWQARKAK
jgi:hypothetical protein